ncbi:MAG: DUF996 domain-containing protein [Thermoprotei archaeon]|nr:DUF996 domain-containing protein [Thermoprotei archaeon]
MSSDFSIARVLGLTGSILIVVGVAASIFMGVVQLFAFIRLFYAQDFQGYFQTPLDTSLTGLYLLPHLNLIGWALVIVSLYFSSRVYGEGGIFKYAVYSVASIVVGVVGAIIIVLLAIIGVILSAAPIGLFLLLAAIIVVLAGIVLMGYFMYRSLSLLSEKSGEPLFRAAGIIMFIAAVTMIILIGSLIELVGAIVLAIAFYTLKPPGGGGAHSKEVKIAKEDLEGQREHSL